MKNISWKKEWLYLVIAFCLPLIFFWTIFTTRSFGFDCAPAVMGDNPPYQQQWKGPNFICNSLPDPGGYTWEYPAYWSELAGQYLSFQLPLWTQNVGIGIPFAADFHLSAYFIPLWPFILLYKLSGLNLFWIDLFFLFRYCFLSLGMYLFLRSIGVSRRVSMIGGMGFFSTGYYIVVPSMAQHNVDILLPFIGFGLNQFLVTKRVKWAGITAFCIGLSMLGGMPECSIFVLFFTGIYLLFLSFFHGRFNWMFFLWGCSSIVLGILIGSIIYIPGLEFVANSTSIHHDGNYVNKYVSWHHMVPFVFPKIFITPTAKDELLNAGKLPFKLEIWNYVGSIITFLFISACGFLAVRLKQIKSDKHILILAFFVVLSFVLMTQLWGFIKNPLFELFPVFKETTFPKYSSTILNFSLIVSICLFIDFACRKRTYAPLFGILGLLVFCGVVMKEWAPVFTELRPFYKTPLINTNMLFGLIWAIILVFIIVRVKNRSFIPVLIFLILCTEIYYVLPKGIYNGRYDSLRQPPAVSWLKDHGAANEYRILGLENILYPNLSSTYNLNDMRILEALFQKRYYAFLKNFYAEPEMLRITGIKENGATEQANITTNPFFDLLSVKYLLSYNTLETVLSDRTAFIQKIVSSSSPSPRLRLEYVSIGKERKPILFAHAPTKVIFSADKPVTAEYFILYPVLMPEVFNLKQGDGVTFDVKAYLGEELIAQQSIILSPEKSQDNKWQQIKLGPFSKEERLNLKIELMTDIRETESYDWSGWAGFYWDSDVKEVNKKYKLVYDKEMKVFENGTALPRFHFVSRTVCSKPEDVIEVMKKNSIEIKNIAVIEKDGCRNKSFSTMEAKLHTQQYSDLQSEVMYSAKSDQYGVFQNAFYPGWNVYVNGEKKQLDPANSTFQGVALPAGTNVKVQVKYEPLSFIIGLALTLISSIIALVITLKKNEIN